MALNKVDFPTLGKPTIPAFNGMAKNTPIIERVNCKLIFLKKIAPKGEE